MHSNRRILTVGSLIPQNSKISVEFHNVQQNLQQDSQKNLQQGNPKKNSSIIQFNQGDHIFKVVSKKDSLLLDQALAQHQPVAYKCRQGTCGKCKVGIIKGSNLLYPPTEKEHHLLKGLISQQYRLACQSKFNQ